MDGLSKSLAKVFYYGSAITSTRFQITNDAHALMLKLLSSHITQLGKEIIPSSCLANEMESDTIRKALDSATKMLSDVNRGESIDKEAHLSEVYLFRIAVEGIRIALNKSGRLPIWNLVDAEKHARGNVHGETIFIRRDNQGSNTVSIVFCSGDELIFCSSYTLYDDNEEKSKTCRHLTVDYVWSQSCKLQRLRGWSSMKRGWCVQVQIDSSFSSLDCKTGTWDSELT
ncbi:hypothetical protein YC2023_036755 [Brassica napus]